MPEDLSKKSALIVDSGLYTHMAERLAESFGKTLYFAEWRGQFPTSKWGRIGTGLAGIERVRSLWDNLDKVDVVVFLDIYNSDIQVHLRRLGMPVWGNGTAEELELDRQWVKNFLQVSEMPTSEWESIVGLDELIEHVKDKEDLWIKGGAFRGDFESFHYENLWLAKPWIDELRHSLGPGAETYEFLVEAPIKGVEVGFDGYSVDGEFPQVASYGYEAKDAGYLGKVYNGTEELPAAVRRVTAALSPILRSAQARGFLSLELRVGPSRRPFLLDPCLRCGSPPSEGYSELFSNWADVVWQGAHGVLVDAKPAARYVAQLILKSDWAKENWLSLDIEPAVQRWVKLHNHCVVDRIDYVVPTGIETIGAVVGIGKTLEEAVRLCHEHAEGVRAYQLAFDDDAFDSCFEAIEEGQKYGIDW